jgi:predicted GNAT superfamily acetyltransferase
VAIHAGGAAIQMTRDVHLSDTYAAARQARRDAQDAATRSRVRVSETHSERDIRGIAEVGDQLWGPGGTLAPNELRALIHAGASVHAAFDQQQPGEPMIGFALGFLGWAPAVHLHSHQVGVLSEHRRRGVGYALKLAQRQTCLRFGVTDMRWTFDPLIRRNTAFNLGALGANAASFYPNFYGHMGDAINGEDASDRLEAVWDLLRPLPVRKCSGASRPPAQAPATKAPVLLAEHEGWPRHTHAAPTRGAMIGVPGDYEELRKRDPQCSAAWRAASREVLLQVYAAGLRIGEVDEAGYRLVPNGEV